MHLNETFAVMTPGLSVTPVSVTPTLYQELDEKFDRFRGHVLVSMHAFSGDWPAWEKHPAGDEIVVLLSGQATMVLKTASGEDCMELTSPGDCVIVPRDTWHTSRIGNAASMLFITPGEGTENRENMP